MERCESGPLRHLSRAAAERESRLVPLCCRGFDLRLEPSRLAARQATAAASEASPVAADAA